MVCFAGRFAKKFGLMLGLAFSIQAPQAWCQPKAFLSDSQLFTVSDLHVLMDAAGNPNAADELRFSPHAEPIVLRETVPSSPNDLYQGIDLVLRYSVTVTAPAPALSGSCNISADRSIRFGGPNSRYAILGVSAVAAATDYVRIDLQEISTDPVRAQLLCEASTQGNRYPGVRIAPLAIPLSSIRNTFGFGIAGFYGLQRDPRPRPRPATPRDPVPRPRPVLTPGEPVPRPRPRSLIFPGLHYRMLQ